MSRSDCSVKPWSRGGVVGLSLGKYAWAGAGVALLTCGFTATDLFAAPQGEQVQQGSATFTRDGNLTKIVAADRTIINYSSFDIHRNETVQFIQPSAASKVLNRITSADPTKINGTLTSNGIVYIVNPAGVYFGNGALVNVGGIYAAAANISNQDFNVGRNNFTGVKGAVTNSGRITAAAGGVAALIGKNVSNAGVVSVDRGVIAMVAGDDIVLNERGGVMSVRVTPQGSPAGTQPGTGVVNSGIVSAKGGTARIVAGDMYSLAVRNTGTVQASNIDVQARGRGDVSISGKLDARNGKAGGFGGVIQVTGDRIAVVDASIDASGRNGGGTVNIGGGLQGQGDLAHSTKTIVQNSNIRADAIRRGDGGQVVVWSDDHTTFSGKASARGGELNGDGGLVETSGKNTIDIRGAQVNAAASNGKGGSWLMDPFNVTIDQVGSTSNGSFSGGDPDTFTPSATAVVDVDDVNLALSNGTSVEIITGGAGADSGDITVAAAAVIDKTGGGPASLTLRAANNVIVAGTIKSSSGTLDVNLLANNGSGGNVDPNPAMGSVQIGIAGSIDTNNGNVLVEGMDFQLAAGGSIQSGTGDITLRPTAMNSTVGVGAGATGAFNVSDTELAGMNGSGTLSIGRSDGTGAVDINAIDTSAQSYSLAVTGGSIATESITVGNARSLSLTANSGNIDDAMAGTLTASNGTITLRADDVTFGGNMNIDAGAGTVNLLPNAGRTIGVATATVLDFNIGQNEVDDITAGTLVIGDSMSGAMTVGNVDATGQAANLELRTGGAVIAENFATNVTAANSVTLSAAGDIGSGAQRLAIDTPNLSLTTTGMGSDMFIQTKAASTSVPLVSASGDADFLSDGAIDFFGTVGGNFAVSAAGNVSALGLDVTGDADFTSTLNDADLSVLSSEIGGTITLHTVGTGGNADVSSVGAIDLGASTIGGDLSVTSETGITDSGPIAVGDEASFKTLNDAGGDIILDAANTYGGPVTVRARNNADSASAAGQIDVRDTDGTMQIAGAESTKSLTFRADDVDVLGTVSGGDITLAPLTNGTTVALNDASGSFSVSASDLANLDSSGTVTVGSASAGAVNIGSLGAIDLSGENYSLTVLGGAMTFNNGVTLADNKTLTLDSSGAIDGSNMAVDATVGGSNGRLLVISAGNVNLDTSVAILAANAAGSLIVDEADALTVGSVGMVDGITAVGVDIGAGGPITVSENIASSGAGQVNLTATGGDAGDINVNADVTSATGGISISADNDVAFGPSSSVTSTSGTIDILADADTMNSGGPGTGGAVTIGDNVSISTASAVSITADGDIDDTADMGGPMGTLSGSQITLTSNNGEIGGTTAIDTATTALIASGKTGVRVTNTGDVVANLDSDMGQVRFNNTGTVGMSDAWNADAFTVGATGAISVTENISADNGDAIVSSDGVITVQAGNSITTTSGNIEINASDLTLDGTLDSGMDDIAIGRSAAGTLGVGTATGDMTISGDELQRMTGDRVTLGGGNVTGITVAGVTEANTANFNLLNLDATRDDATITFNGSASTFEALTAAADDGITVDVNLTATQGVLTLDGDADDAADTDDRLHIADGIVLSTEPMGGNVSLAATTGGVVAAGSLTVNSNADIILGSSISSPGSMALNANGQIILETAQSGQTLTINADDGLTLNANVTNTASAAILNADADADGNGTLTLASGQTINTGSNDLTLTAADLVLDGSISSGAGTVSIRRATMGTIGLGSAMGDMQISADELSRISAATLRIGNSLTTGMNIAGVGSASTGGITAGIELITDAIDISGIFNTSAADLTITRANNGSIGIGTGSGDMTITGSELMNITAPDLVIGGGQTTDINVGGVTAGQSANIANLRLEAADRITFSGGASTFRALSAIAADGITVASNLTTTTGNMVLEANSDNDSDTMDNLAITDGRVIASAGTLTLDATAGGIDAAGAVTLRAVSDIVVNDNLSADGPIVITADSDGSGQGVLNVPSGVTVLSSGNPITINASNLLLNGNINAGAGSVAIDRSNAGTITLGIGTDGMVISGAELARITATGLTIGGGNTAALVVNGITASNSNSIVGVTSLRATADQGAVVFNGSASTFNALDVLADNAITLNSGVTTDTGGITMNANADGASDGIDAVRLGANVTAPATQDVVFNSDVQLRRDVTIAGNDITFNGKIDSESGRRSLTVNTSNSGLTIFDGTVGGTRALKSLTTNADGITRIGANITVDTRDATFNDPVRLTNDVRIRGMRESFINFNNTVDSQGNTNRSLTVLTDTTLASTTSPLPVISFARDVGSQFALGNLYLNYDPGLSIDGHTQVPRVASIIVRPRNASGQIISSPSTTFAFNVSNTFRMGKNEKLTAAGNLAINAGSSAVIGDLSALRDISVHAPSIMINRREASQILGQLAQVGVDTGTDIVAGGVIDFSVAPTAIGAGTEPVFSTSTGSGDVNSTLGGFLFRAFGPLANTDIDSAPSNFVTLDLKADGPTNTNFADAIAGAIPRETRQNDVGQETAIGQAEMEDLKNIGIIPRNPTTEELLDFLIGRAVFNDMPGKGGQRSSQYTTVVNRLPGERVAALLRSYDRIFNTDLVDEAGNKVLDDQGKPRRVSRSEEIKSTLLGSVRRYRSENPQVTGEVDPLQFRAYVDNTSEEAQSKDYLEQLAQFLDVLETLGLTPRELQTSKNILLKDVRPAGVGSVANFESIIRSQARSPETLSMR